MLLQNLPQNAHSLRVAIDAMPVGVSWANLSDQKILFMNRKFTEIFGYRFGDFATISDWVEGTYPFPEDRERVQRTWGAYLLQSQSPDFAACPNEIPAIEIRIRCSDGSVKTILNSGILLPEAGWALATFVDITERKIHELRLEAAERQAAENEAIYRLLLDHATEMIVLSPFDESRRYVSSAVTRITGFSQKEYLATKPLNTIHPEDREQVQAVLAGLKNGQLHHAIRYRILRKGGGYGWVDAVITGYLDPLTSQPAGYFATVRDVATEVAREEQLVRENRVLSEAVTRDDLTGIANRRAFNRAMAGEASRHTRSNSDLSLMMIDVDFFKNYNDLYGHLAGDACLRAIAGALSQCVRRDADLVARYGGEEFAVLMPSTDLAGAKVVAASIQARVRALGIPHHQSPHRAVTVSIGVASWPPGLDFDSQQLIERADRALYQAKAEGRNRYATG